MPLSKIDTAALGNASGNLTVGPNNGESYGGKLSVTNNGQATAFFWNSGVGSGHVGIGAGSSNLKLYNTYANGLIASGKGIDIDTEGRVLAPYQPAFKAGRSGSYGSAANATIIFNDVSGNHYNRGGHYNTSSGRFTAPVAGMYFFTACIIWEGVPDGTNMTDACYLYKNGGMFVYSFRRGYYRNVYTGDGGYYVDHVNSLVPLGVGEYATIQNRQALTIHGNTNYTWFAGYLLG